ncbi:MAG: Uma2 family endonuclease [Chitinophagales bacterium]|nr:Uma2 family endonuclease [Chitinophagales bacterium]
MESILEPLINSPKLNEYVAELQNRLFEERDKRYAFYESISEDDKAEFINGNVIMQSPATAFHTSIVANLVNLMRNYVHKQKLGEIFFEKALVTLTRNDYEPDIIFYTSAKANNIKPEQLKFPAPDLIVEVLSRSTESIDRGVKFEDYAHHGVDEYWLVDPSKLLIEQYFLSNKNYQLNFKDTKGTIVSRAITGFKTPVNAIFDSTENQVELRSILLGN